MAELYKLSETEIRWNGFDQGKKKRPARGHCINMALRRYVDKLLSRFYAKNSKEDVAARHLIKLAVSPLHEMSPNWSEDERIASMESEFNSPGPVSLRTLRRLYNNEHPRSFDYLENWVKIMLSALVPGDFDGSMDKLSGVTLILAMACVSPEDASELGYPELPYESSARQTSQKVQ